MKITNDMIHPDILRTGILLRKILRFQSSTALIRAQKILSLVKGVLKSKNLNVTELYIQTPDNACLRACVYKSQEPKPDAVGLLWIHGGGYAMGAPEQDITFITKFIAAANCVVVAPDYRLSIETPYPAALNDCYDALLWMKEHADELGIRADQLFVGGESAGGGLTASVTLLARDRREVSVAFQMPFYPMLDDRMATPSALDNDAPGWNARSNETAWKLYLGDLFGSDAVPPYAAPSREKNYAGLPPTYSFVGDIEPFCDETIKYISDLQSAGVPAELDVYPGCFHAFDVLCAGSAISQKATRTYLDKFKYASEHCFSEQPQKELE